MGIYEINSPPFFIKHNNEKKNFLVCLEPIRNSIFSEALRITNPKIQMKIKCITVDDKICNCSQKFCKKKLDKNNSQHFQEICRNCSEFVEKTVLIRKLVLFLGFKKPY